MEGLVGKAGEQLLAAWGPFAGVVILMASAIVYLFRSLQDCQSARVKDAEKLATALERASTTNAALAAAVEARNIVIRDLTHTVAEQTRIIADEHDRSRDAFDALRQAFGELRQAMGGGLDALRSVVGSLGVAFESVRGAIDNLRGRGGR